MDRYKKKFREMKKDGRIAFMPFLVGGDPSPERSLSLLQKVVKHADALEIGVPFSDPVADGPTIQKADMRALEAGTTPRKVFAIVRKLRKSTDIPITLLVYANGVHARGIEAFYRDAKNSGVDGVLIPDVPIEEIEIFQKAAKKAGIKVICLVTPTTTKERRKKILKYAEGFIYIVSVRGVTGARRDVQKEAIQLVRDLKKETNVPLVVGFGISKKEHLQVLEKAGADGAIVGSALIETIEKNNGNKGFVIKKYLETFTK